MKLLTDDLYVALLKYLETKPINEAIGLWHALQNLKNVEQQEMGDSMMINRNGVKEIIEKKPN